MGSKVMPLANFHRNCWREDKTHALYVFSILSPFNRCINCTCRHNISREIYFCTNPTHRRLREALKMRSKSGLTLRLAHYLAEVQRTFMLTYVLFMSVIQCHFPQFADRLGTSVQAKGLFQVLQNIVDLNRQVVQRLL